MRLATARDDAVVPADGRTEPVRAMSVVRAADGPPASPPALRSRRVRAATALAGLVALGVGYARLEYRAFTKASLALLVAAQIAPVVFDAV